MTTHEERIARMVRRHDEWIEYVYAMHALGLGSEVGVVDFRRRKRDGRLPKANAA